jgi:hypothetical protein
LLDLPVRYEFRPANVIVAIAPADEVEFLGDDAPLAGARVGVPGVPGTPGAGVEAPDAADDPGDPELLEDTPAESPAAVGLEGAVVADPLAAPLGPNRGGIAGRTRAGRQRGVRVGGGSGASEAAVERGLRWLAAHQEHTGGWRFDHRTGPCQGQCADPGTAGSTTAATGVALLAFLGAGYTHKEGEYERVVRDGIYYLKNRMLPTPDGGDLQEGTMYGQGLATIALVEAYAMTQDPELAAVAQSALDFIVFAQDAHGGGWRYAPGQPGDTTVTGWQYMAIKSGQMAYLIIPARTVIHANRFLDQVQSDHGALYGYQTPDGRQSTTAVGLLCRMYGGWPRNNPALVSGVARLAKWGPSRDDLYYNYYATQVLRHYGGAEWEEWNRSLRDPLIAAQATTGHESGSWYAPGEHCRPGGRLLSTALAVMTLEVYYRYLPLYGNEAWEEEW